MGFYGLGIQILIQLASVPLFTIHWGLGGYGVWLILFSVPSLLAMADFGLTTAGANTMVAAVAQGDRPRAARIHSALRTITLLVSAVLLVLTAVAVLLVWPGALDLGGHFPPEQVRKAVVFLALYGVLALVNGVTLAGFRAADAFAFSGTVYQTMLLAEAGCALLVLALGGSLAEVALAYFLARLTGTVIFSALLHRRAAWLPGLTLAVDWAEVRALLRPALAAVVLPGGHAIALQGSVMALGAIAGPAAVPAYTVARTLSRTALQFAMRFNIASMPRFTIASAQGDQDRVADLVLLNLVVSALFVIPAAAAIVLLGQPIVALWTGHRVEVSLPLLVAMAAAMLGNAGWVPLSNLLLAINRHASFTYAMLVVSILAVGLGAALVGSSGALGMAVAMVALELVMVGWVWWQARRNGLIDYPALARMADKYAAQLRAGKLFNGDNGQ